MSVVLRCPSCGTTRATPGECEACHEADVRYFCTNHTPGLWLDARTCPACGAAFGAPAHPASVPAPARVERSRVPAAVPRRAPARASAAPAPPLGYSRRSGPVPDEDEADASAGAMAPWQRILGAVIRGRLAAFDPARPARRAASGCLTRLVLLGLFLFCALVVALFFFGRAVFQGFQLQ